MASAAPINLMRGHPAVRHLSRSVAVLRDASAHRFASLEKSPQETDDLLSYTENACQTSFRRELANFLNTQLGYPTPITADELFIVPGISMGVDLVAQNVKKIDGEAMESTLVFVEEPTYFLAPQMFMDNGFSINGIPVDAEGLDVDHLEARLRAGARPRFLYTIPVHQNPTGTTLSDARRKKLVALSKEFKFVIVADEVYQMLTYRGAAPPLPLASYDYAPHTVVSVGAFSKLLSPGIRVGWLNAHPSLLEQVNARGVFESGGGLSAFAGAIVESALVTGTMKTHIDYLLKEYVSLSQKMFDLLTTHLPAAGNFKFTQPNGGYFFWIECDRTKVDVTKLAAEISKQKVIVLWGQRCTGFGGETRDLTHFFRVCHVYLEEADVAEGVRRVGEAARASLIAA